MIKFYVKSSVDILRPLRSVRFVTNGNQIIDLAHNLYIVVNVHVFIL